jgi:hypothetical protein
VLVGVAFSDLNGSSAFSSQVAIDSIKVVIWNIEPHMGFKMCLWEESNVYM